LFATPPGAKCPIWGFAPDTPVSLWYLSLKSFFPPSVLGFWGIPPAAGGKVVLRTPPQFTCPSSNLFEKAIVQKSSFLVDFVKAYLYLFWVTYIPKSSTKSQPTNQPT